MDKENAVLETLAPDGGVSKGKERSRKELLEQWRASKQNAVRKPLANKGKVAAQVTLKSAPGTAGPVASLAGKKVAPAPAKATPAPMGEATLSISTAARPVAAPRLGRAAGSLPALLEQAQKLVQSKCWSAAEDLYSSMLLGPHRLEAQKSAEFWVQRAHASEQMGRYAEAVAMFERAKQMRAAPFDVVHAGLQAFMLRLAGLPPVPAGTTPMLPVLSEEEALSLSLSSEENDSPAQPAGASTSSTLASAAACATPMTKVLRAIVAPMGGDGSPFPAPPPPPPYEAAQALATATATTTATGPSAPTDTAAPAVAAALKTSLYPQVAHQLMEALSRYDEAAAVATRAADRARVNSGPADNAAQLDLAAHRTQTAVALAKAKALAKTPLKPKVPPTPVRPAAAAAVEAPMDAAPPAAAAASAADPLPVPDVQQPSAPEEQANEVAHAAAAAEPVPAAAAASPHPARTRPRLGTPARRVRAEDAVTSAPSTPDCAAPAVAAAASSEPATEAPAQAPSGAALSVRIELATPGRLRRAVATAMEAEGRATAVFAASAPRQRRRGRAAPSDGADATSADAAGSLVVLEPVRAAGRAGKRLAAEMGAELFLSPVRRSVRKAGQRAQPPLPALLEGAGWAYAANPFLEAPAAGPAALAGLDPAAVTRSASAIMQARANAALDAAHAPAEAAAAAEAPAATAAAAPETFEFAVPPPRAPKRRTSQQPDELNARRSARLSTGSPQQREAPDRCVLVRSQSKRRRDTPRPSKQQEQQQ